MTQVCVYFFATGAYYLHVMFSRNDGFWPTFMQCPQNTTRGSSSYRKPAPCMKQTHLISYLNYLTKQLREHYRGYKCMLPIINMFLCKYLCVIRETFRRTRLEHASAHPCDPGAVLPAVPRGPAGRVPGAGTPLCLWQSPQARPRGSPGQSDADVS